MRYAIGTKFGIGRETKTLLAQGGMSDALQVLRGCYGHLSAALRVATGTLRLWWRGRTCEGASRSRKTSLAYR